MPIAAIPTSPIRIITEDACDDICTGLRVSPKAPLIQPCQKAKLAADLFEMLEAAEKQVEMEEAAAKLKIADEARTKKTGSAKKFERPKREKKKFAAATSMEAALWARASGAGFNLSLK